MGASSLWAMCTVRCCLQGISWAGGGERKEAAGGSWDGSTCLMGWQHVPHGMAARASWDGSTWLMGWQHVAHGMAARASWDGSTCLMGWQHVPHGIAARGSWDGSTWLMGWQHVAHGMAARGSWDGSMSWCHAELEALMERCERKDGDVVILVGDMVNKGPDSHAVLRMARRMGAVAVRGNHDDKALAVAAAAATGKSKRWRNSKWPSDLSSTDLEWLLSLPFSIRIPSHNCLVVHAGLVPGGGMDSSLSEWDAHDWLVSGGDSSSGEGEEANGWARGWGWEACKAADEGAVLWSHEWRGREHVVFGHDAVRGLQRTPWATGLDTGCVYGGRLTACVLPSLAQLQQLTHARAAEQRREGHQGAVRVWPMLQIVSVAAQRQYAMPKVKGRK
ncbi:unnamed protein product [Closterium sp. Yama58-4]|nr:unnamed protein product [Closterium sp. Yama58-4]